uniref:Transmembrane protein n=1 Tax=Macrostomum lignano TaxID=282301 RepID=A0A1I8FQN1_9PLAT
MGVCIKLAIVKQSRSRLVSHTIDSATLALVLPVSVCLSSFLFFYSGAHCFPWVSCSRPAFKRCVFFCFTQAQGLASGHGISHRVEPPVKSYESEGLKHYERVRKEKYRPALAEITLPPLSRESGDACTARAENRACNRGAIKHLSMPSVETLCKGRHPVATMSSGDLQSLRNHSKSGGHFFGPNQPPRRRAKESRPAHFVADYLKGAQ